MNYYNDNDPKICAWLRELIADGRIPTGDVDERSIADVKGDDLGRYRQCHFFAGIGGWAYALRLAGWADDRPVWTGSCPCQPFSVAGKRRGTNDERHLWPEFARLIGECKPPIVFGEQVASKDGRAWLAGVRADVEKLGYACGAADLCAAGVGAPHIRQRLFWMAYADVGRGESRNPLWPEPVEPGDNGEKMPKRNMLGEISSREKLTDQREAVILDGCPGWNGETRWHECTDGKLRRVPAEPAFFPLVDGLSAERMGLLRGAGNAIVPQLAAEFIQAALEATGDVR